MNFPTPSEILMIAVLGLVIFGPHRLPEIARQIGRAIAEVRRVSREFEREVREVAEPYAKEFRDATQPIVEGARSAEEEARRAYAMDDDLSTFLPPPKSPPSEG